MDNGKEKSTLINPGNYDYSMFDERTKQVFADTIAFIENRGCPPPATERACIL